LLFFIQEEDYCGAIQLCLECQEAASTYRHFKCIRSVFTFDGLWCL